MIRDAMFLALVTAALIAHMHGTTYATLEEAKAAQTETRSKKQ
jgi:hypothetical protein